MKFQSNINCLTLAVSLVAGGAAGFQSGVYAVESDDDKDIFQFLEEIIVTAEKREQKLQDVPSAISAFSAEMLEFRGIDKPQDLQFSVPGLSIGKQNNTGGTAKATIRGIGTENYQPGGDPGVPIHINGHYTQSTAYVFRDMIDVDRVEVQRGPQGTLYGRNAIGGNINIITKRPTSEFEGQIGVDVGNYNKHYVQTVLSGPFTENLRGRLVIADSERDGYVKDVGIVGDDRNNSDYSSARGALEFDVTDNIQIYINAHYFDDKGSPYARRLDDNPANLANTEVYKVRTNTPSKQTDKSNGASIDVSWSFGDMEFRSLSAYDDTVKSTILDTDNSDTRSTEFGFELGYKTLTQEFQLLSTDDSPLQWVTGLYYYREDSQLIFDLKLDEADTNADGVIDDADPRWVYAPTYDINASSLAAYGQVDYALTDQLKVVAGLRYTKDEKDRIGTLDFSFDDGSSGSLFGGYFIAPSLTSLWDNGGGNEWEEVTGKLGLNYDMDEDLMFYISYSRGYKAGGYDADQDDPYDPETLDAYELGMKSQWLESRIQLNMAAFYYRYNDKQDFQRFFDNGISKFRILNASSVRSSGVELELQAYLTDALFVDGSITYLSAEFEEYDSIDNSFPALGLQDLSGNKLPLSPEWKFNIGVQYDWDLDGGFGHLTLRGDYVWVDDQYGNAFNRDGTELLGDGDLMPSYHIANAQLRWESVGGAWLAKLYVANLTDETVVSNAYVATPTDVNQSYLAPRTYGVKLSYKY